MKINIDEIKKEPLKKERIAYNGRTGNRISGIIDVEVYLSPLRAMYKVGKEGEESANLFDNLDSAVGKFNLLEEEDKKSCETCGVTQDSYCNECEEYNKWFKKEA